MDKKLRFIFVFILVSNLFFQGIGCVVDNDSARFLVVTEVIDGDTYKISNGYKVRLIGINTPEIHHPSKGVEYFGQEAFRYAKKLLLNKKVALKYDVERQDKYGRTLAYVYLADGTFVNELLVKEGYARTMTIPPNVSFAELFRKMEREARENNRGLWANNKIGEHMIKGNINKNGEKIYHLPGGKFYQQTKAEVYFATEEEARRAGFRKAKG